MNVEYYVGSYCQIAFLKGCPTLQSPLQGREDTNPTIRYVALCIIQKILLGYGQICHGREKSKNGKRETS